MFIIPLILLLAKHGELVKMQETVNELTRKIDDISEGLIPMRFAGYLFHITVDKTYKAVCVDIADIVVEGDNFEDLTINIYWALRDHIKAAKLIQISE